MEKTILVAGGTGNLGGRIVNALLQQGAQVRMLVRPESDKVKTEQFVQRGVDVVTVDMANSSDLVKACTGVACVVSALQGLADVIVDAQTNLLKAAVAAGVPRFIPSDFSTDFTDLPAGENRNFDLRRAFHKHLDAASIAATSVYNGAFAEILSYNMPLLDFKNKTVAYWGSNADWKMDFTTMDDTAAFTAAAALDAATPRALHIASFQVSPRQLAEKTQYTLTPMGRVEDFAAYNQRERAAHPEGEGELFPKWQSAQYLHDMFCTHHPSLDNGRYPQVTWTNADAFLQGFFKK